MNGGKRMLNATGFSRVILSLILIAVALAGCASVGMQDLLTIRKDPVRANQGFETRKATAAEYPGLYQDQGMSEYVATVGSRLAAVSDRPTLMWQFSVVDSPKPLVFATRDGDVSITRGMLALLRSESDLAAVLAHEISHVSTPNALRADTLEDTVDLGILVATVAYPHGAIFVGQLRTPANAGAAVLSRHDEFEADRRGVENLRRADYPPESMAAVLEIFASLDAYDHRYLRPTTYSPYQSRSFAAQLFDPASSPPVIGLPPRITHLTEAMPNPYERRAKLGNRLWSHVSADPAFLARLDGLEFGDPFHTSLPQSVEQNEVRPKPSVLRIYRVQEGDTFASLARAAREIPEAEDLLRLLNQRYPDGEPEVGELVKVIE
jgi:predicted Zn-dependent protease